MPDELPRIACYYKKYQRFAESFLVFDWIACPVQNFSHPPATFALEVSSHKIREVRIILIWCCPRYL